VFIVITADDNYMASFDKFEDAVKYAREFPNGPWPRVIEPTPNSYEYQYRYIKTPKGELDEKQLATINVMFSYKYRLVPAQDWLRAMRKVQKESPEQYEKLMADPVIKRRFRELNQPGTIPHGPALTQ
jgi:hypothetical protein